MRRKRLIDPYRQGDLDGLCGLYAVINAIRAITPKNFVSESDADSLFTKLTIALEQNRKRPGMVVNGTSVRDMGRFLRIGSNWLRRRDYLFGAVRPIYGTRRPDIGPVFDLLRYHVERVGRAAIICIREDEIEHWTVVYTSTGDQLGLLDSSDDWSIRRRSVTTQLSTSAPSKIFIFPRRIFLLTAGKL